MKKKDQAKLLIKKQENSFKCPICEESMTMSEDYQLICENHHSFDLAKKGYLNLLQTHNGGTYAKDLFESRHLVNAAGFYEPLMNKMTEIIKERMGNELIILDAGCGEGSHIHTLSKKIDATFFGIDIAKTGIQIATRYNSDIIWCVADLANLPLKDNAIDIILNILSPANYDEFSRLLNEDGWVIKVIPGVNYLKEIREIYYKDNTYSNEEIIKHFSKHLAIIEREEICYEFTLDEKLVPHLMKMTPLSWGKNIDMVKGKLSSITIDLVILVGKRRSSV